MLLYMSLTKEEKHAKAEVARYFKGIGQHPYKTPFEMKFTDGVNIFTEEPDDIFTSLNYVAKILKKIKPSLYSKIMTKPQAIRFIRIIEQYLISSRGKLFTFILPDNFPFEITDSENSSTFIRRITRRFDELRETLNIVEQDIIDDTPDILKITDNEPTHNSSSASNSDNSNSSNSNHLALPLKTKLKPVEPVNLPAKKVPPKKPLPKKAPKRVIERANASVTHANLNLNAPNVVQETGTQLKPVTTEEYTREEYIEDVTEMFDYELRKIDKEDMLRIEARIKEDNRRYDDITQIERAAQMEVDAFIEQTVNKYKNSLVHHYKHTTFAYNESKRQEILDDFILKLPNIRNRYFLSEYIKPKINLANVLNVRKRMEEPPRNKFASMHINLKHYSIKDRRNIEEKLLRGVPIHQIRREYKPVPRKAHNRPRTERKNANRPSYANRPAYAGEAEQKGQHGYKPRPRTERKNANRPSYAGEAEQKGQHGYKPRPRQPSKKTTVFKVNAPVTQKVMPKPRGKPIPK